VAYSRETLKIFPFRPEISDLFGAICQPTESAIYEFDNFRIDSGKRLFSNGGAEPIQLTPKIVDTLLYLVSRHGTVIDKDELMSAIWPDSVVEENNLNKNISVLRRVLGENPGDNRYIVTVPGKGYKFVADVRVTASDKIQETLNNGLPDLGQENKHPTFWFVIAGAAVLISALTGLFVLSWQNDPIGDHVPRSIAVLPFKPLAADGRDEFRNRNGGCIDRETQRTTRDRDTLFGRCVR
jgi:serine/threonine-protein kinase